jgi:tetratricopeptide (TPR) repeat protein
MVYRPEEGPVQAFHQRLGAAASRHASVVELTALSRDDSVRLLQNLLQWEELPAETRRLILEKAEGNAFFLEEVLRSLIDAGMLLLQGDRLVVTQAIQELQIPDSLQGVIMARIDRLPQHEKQTLQTASVIGRVFQQLVLTHLLAPVTPDDAVDRSLAELRRRELIRLREAATLSPPADEPEYIFKHAVTQDVAYQSLLIARRKALHHQVGETLEALFPDRLSELAGTLAYHYERAEVRDKAIRYLTEAADRARSTYANEEAIAFYRRAMEQVRPQLAAEGAERAAGQRTALSLLENEGEVLELAARHEEARSVYEEALTHVPDADCVTRARLLRKTGRVLDGLQRFDDAFQAFALAASSLGELCDGLDTEGWQEWIEIHLDRIRTHYWRGEIAEMVALIERLQPQVDQHGLARQRSRLTYTRLNVAFRQERYQLSDQTLGYARAFLADSQRSGELSALTSAHFVMGFTHLWRSELDEAEKQFQASMALAERTGDVTYQSMCATYQAVIHRMRGHVEAVRQLLPRCRELGAAASRINYIGVADANEAWAAYRDGDLAQVERSARSAFAHWQRSSGSNPLRWLALWPLIGAALARGETGAAIEHARELFGPTQQPPPDALAVPLQAAIAAWEAGRTDEARGLLVETLPLAREQGYL